MIVKGYLRKYIGAITLEIQAARLYDKYAMIIKVVGVLGSIALNWWKD